MCKEKPGKGLKKNICMDNTRKEARMNRNNKIKCLKKEANGAKTNRCSIKLSFPYSQKKRKTEKLKETSYFCNEGKVKRFKPKSGADVSRNISLKKQICELENTDVAHSSEACSDSAFLLVDSEHKLMMTADQTNTGPWNAYVPMTQTLSKEKGSKGCTRSNYTDIFKNEARLYQRWNETSEQQNQRNFELKTQPTTRHANIVSAGTQTFDLASVFL